MAHKLGVAFVLAALTTVVAGGCGGQAALSRQQLISQADVICKRVELERATAVGRLTVVSTSNAKELKEVGRLAPGLSQEQQRGVARLRALKAPASLEHDWQELLTGMQQLAAETAKVGVAARAGNGKGVEAITASGAPIRSGLERIAQQVGFKYCGR
jgi:hypothetical protein